MASGHEVEITWPHPEPEEVILCGTFNQWDRTFHLTKGPTGFAGTITVPWGKKTAYKFIVDGKWACHSEQPTEPDGDGNVNNVYTAPPPPPMEDNASSSTSAADKGKGANGKPAAPPPNSTSIFPQLVSDIADTVSARAGTSSALGYVASGIGAAIHNVVGVDPVNGDQARCS
ncbi:hypothetical protein FPV67DRAFT_396535 [Lyophyllum atratum]|nr:hypothetical protein FPV67DRAFT_396535 [Lyophyllum atratum]